jgi:hypothetical protein
LAKKSKNYLFGEDFMTCQLGFGNSLRPIKIFVGKESGSLWYLWDEENQKPAPIEKASLSGYISRDE